ncbi:hypothetical protein LC613_17820 [Nostoc sphaeroides CHAB 2801]|uniref:hypothetical protein n=1 Tax=Nostoc sphaeroides TaxID=446679 RepID=UPI000E510B6B|nr:hypothetical protein [Nostoc sphaeroides]MCC5629800.1 hypothetical protein [Nostoc sphaeroides CHAB 2801]
MSELEKLLSDLPNIIDELNFNLGNRNQIKNEILRLDNILAKLNDIQEEIESELGFEKIKNVAMGALPFLGTVASFFIPGGFLLDAVITGGAGLLSEKFGDTETEINLSDLQEKIYEWIGWVNNLQEIAEHILHDSVILTKINNHLYKESINNELQKIDEKIKINLSLNNGDLLKQQIHQITQSQDDLVTLQQRINDIYNTLKNSEDIYKIIIGLSNFYGNSGFALEWLDDEHGLIIFSTGQFESLGDVIDKCEYIKAKIGELILNSNTIRYQAEEVLHRLENDRNRKQDYKDKNTLQSNPNQELATHQLNKKYIFKSLILVSVFSTILLYFFDVISRDKLPQIQQIILNNNQKENPIINVQAAQKIGMEASLMVQNPPHSPEVWKKAQIKWQEAISLLEKIPEGTSVSEEVKKQISTYRINNQSISTRILNEKKATENFESSQKVAIEASLMVQNPPHMPKVWKQAKFKWEAAIKLLESIPKDTFVYKKAQEKLSIYKTNYAVISTQVED